MEEQDRRRFQKDQVDNACEICFDQMFYGSDDSEVAILKQCGCVFHQDCLKPYLKAELDQGNIEIKCPN